MKKIITAIILMAGALMITPNIENISFAEDTDNIIEINQELTQEQAKQLLKEFNSSLEYIYQGTESDFEALQKEGLSGYVFLPNTETDLGLFVDKETQEIYYFHPSGYLKLVK